VSPEAARLKALFARHDYLARQLAEVDRRIAVAGDNYRKTQGYTVKPRLETLRKEVGA
jgi:hypothetical protein